MKIDEPKTPYIRYDSANDLILGSSGSVPPLELSSAIEEAAREQHLPPPLTRGLSSVSDTDDASNARMVQRRRVSVDEWDDDDDDDSKDENMDPKEAERHRKFEQLRASHYDMKSALHPANASAAAAKTGRSKKTATSTTRKSNGRTAAGMAPLGAAGSSPHSKDDSDSDDDDDDDADDDDDDDDDHDDDAGEADDEGDDDGSPPDADEGGQGEIKRLADMRLGPTTTSGGGGGGRHMPLEMDLS
ncbi:hypothetical protein HDU86_001423 [Geranomyces michiganensis]|nr:hypothetical protein HDU86_001423 [Geranomyces michiganensis]